MTFEMHNPWMLLAALPALAGAWWVSRRTLTDFSRTQLRLMLALRSLIIGLLVLALAGVVITHTSSRTAVVMVQDTSDSVTDDAARLTDKLIQETGKRTDDPVIRTTFGKEPSVRTGLGESHVAAGLRFAQALIPAAYVGRIVLVTDGRETAGNMLDEASGLRERGFELVVVGLPAWTTPEVIARKLEVSGTLTAGATAELIAHIASSTETAASVGLFIDGFRMGEPRPVVLTAGENRITSAVRLPESGSHEYTVRVASAADTFDGNNAARTVVVLPAELRVLIIEQDEGDAKFLVRALRRSGLEVDVRTADGFPTDLVDLDRHACVILSDVPATSLLPAQMQMLKTYVEDLGGAFVMIGGEDSFGLGGYFRTPVEEILPVRLDVEKKKEEPTIAMVLCLDKSGSMRGRKVQLAKEAAIATLELLGPDDLVGVVTFDTNAHKVTPVKSVSNRSAIVSTVSGISAGGGTNMYPALREAHGELRKAKARLKHVILLTDGKTHDGEYASLVRRMVRDGITVSCVAVGGNADAVLLQNVSRWGRGRFYYTRDALSIPQIFARETVTAARSAVIEEPFRPRVVRDVEVIRGLDFAEGPYLLGYVSTKPKSTSEVILATERAEPLLARHRVGLGKTAAFTSDVTNRWSAEWLSWVGFDKFWAQLVRDVMRTRAAGTVDLRLRFEDDTGVVTLDAADVAGRFRNRMRTEATVIALGGDARKFKLTQLAPGRYRGSFAAATPGTYVVSVQLGRPGVEGAGDVAVVGAVKPPPAEYTSLDVHREDLERLAKSAGGVFVAPEAWTGSDEDLASLADRIASPSQKRVRVRRALRPALLWAALALFFVDLLTRRVDFSTRRRREIPGGAA